MKLVGRGNDGLKTDTGSAGKVYVIMRHANDVGQERARANGTGASNVPRAHRVRTLIVTKIIPKKDRLFDKRTDR